MYQISVLQIGFHRLLSKLSTTMSTKSRTVARSAQLIVPSIMVNCAYNALLHSNSTLILKDVKLVQPAQPSMQRSGNVRQMLYLTSQTRILQISYREGTQKHSLTQCITMPKQRIQTSRTVLQPHPTSTE